MTIEYDEKGKLYTNIIHKTNIIATIQTAIHRIQGHVHLSDEERLKDELEHTDPFLAATDSIITNSEGETLYQNKFLAVNLSRITWVIQDMEPPEDDKKESV
jgi:hypothetical protein